MKFEWMKRLMKWISGMITWSHKQKEVFNQMSYLTVSSSSVSSILKDKGITNFQITDQNYKLISKKDMIEFMEYNFAGLRKYVPEVYDCDNFSAVLYGQMSYVLSGFAVGIVHVKTKTGAHALNCFIDFFHNFYYIEPQTGKVFSFASGTRKGYKPYFALI